MDNSRVVADTGIFIQFLRATVKERTILYNLPNDTHLMISSVTLYELLMGATSESKRQDVLRLTEDLEILPFNEQVADEAAKIYHKLRRTNEMIEFRDIFIAATCVVYNIPLVTRNKKHFERVEELAFFDVL
jgi:tRNA(fMet)-specific endonuclease VapC